MIVERAAILATLAHDGQVRKYTGEPYVYHCAEVASIMRLHGFNETVQAVAWMHDVLEDTIVRYDRIADRFGAKIANMVQALTDLPRHLGGNRRERNAVTRDRLCQASYEVQSIKCADLISNTRSIVTHDPKFAKVYLEEKRLLLDVMTDCYKPLYEQARILCA